MKGFNYMNEEKYISKRKIISKSIVITIYFSFACYILGEIQSISNWNYCIHEMLYIPITIAYAIIPVQVSVWLYYAIKSYGIKKGFNINKVKLYIKNSITIISLIIISIYFIIQSHSVSTSGIFEINNKIYDGNNYYILINEKKVKCTWNEYN